MAIQDLQAKQGKVDIVVEIVEKGEIREFEKFGKQGRVCNATAKDTTGEIKLTLWNEQIDQVNVGDIVKISNGYVSEFQGEKQLTTGKFGTLEVVEKGSGTSVASGTKQETIAEAAKSDELEEEETENPITDDEKTESEEISNPPSDEGEQVLTDDEKTEEEVLDESEEPPVAPEATATEDELVEAAEEPVEEEKV